MVSLQANTIKGKQYGNINKNNTGINGRNGRLLRS